MKESYREILERRSIPEKIGKLTEKFILNTVLSLVTPKGFKDEDVWEHDFVRKLREVFGQSEDFETESWYEPPWCEGITLHAVSQNGYLYIIYDAVCDVEWEYSSELTDDFVEDIRRAFCNYYGKQISCDLQKYDDGFARLALEVCDELG